MTELGSLLKLDASTSKRRKLSLILEKCVICQKSGRETVVSFTDPEKESLDIVYHKSCCYKSYTSEHNIVMFTSRQIDEVAAVPSKDSIGPSMLTRSKSSTINWSVCIFCNKKVTNKTKGFWKMNLMKEWLVFQPLPTIMVIQPCFLVHLDQRSRWTIAITWLSSSVNFSYFKLLLRNHWANWNQT